MKNILYQDRSGIFGQWYQGEGKTIWNFKKEIELDMSEDQMLHALGELQKIKDEEKLKELGE